jgi:ubiquinone/menaquinone biosynthesis C-methylase UbiE
MFKIQTILLDYYPQRDGIYYCLQNETETHPIKSVEINTYSERAKNFNEQRMITLPPDEAVSLQPLQSLSKGAVILELGGGDGRFAFQLMKEGYTVIESDIAMEAVKRVEKNSRKYNICNGFYMVIDAENLPFKDKSIDAVLLVASLHHFPNPYSALKEIYRVVKPRGKLLILREPASWQFYIFYLVFKLLRKILRQQNKNLFSIADDMTFGFSPQKIKKMLTPYFNKIYLSPVHYTVKIYTNWLILKSKFTKQQYKSNQKIIKYLTSIDRLIKYLPFVKNLPWDWDIYCERCAQ